MRASCIDREKCAGPGSDWRPNDAGSRGDGEDHIKRGHADPDQTHDSREFSPKVQTGRHTSQFPSSESSEQLLLMSPPDHGVFGPRRLLRLLVSAAVAALSGVNAEESMSSVGSDPGPGGTAPVRPFRLDQVRLGGGLLQEKRDRMKNFVREFDEQRFLILFNNQAGRSNPEGLALPGGWEDGGLLSGHWAGHYMTALSQAYADQGEKVFKEKLDWMVAELSECQKAITARMTGGGGGGGGGDDEEPEAPEIIRVPGKFGSALKLEGQGQAEYVTLPQEAINQLRDFTIAGWVNMSTTQTWSRLFDFGQDTTRYMFLTPRSGSTGSTPRFAITTGGSGGEQQINGDTALPTNEWIHIAVTLAEGTGTLYVNGEVAGQNTAMTLNPTDLGNPGNRWIGRSQFGDALLQATVDEFHIFNRALTSEEVQSMQDSATGSTDGGNIAWYKFDEEGGSTVEDSSPNGRSAGIAGDGGSGGGGADWIPTHPGYLGALPEDTVLRLGPPRWAVYGGNAETNTWAPWYTQHKIMRGLLDAYYNTNNTQALDVVTKMAEWAHLALSIGDKNHPDYTGNLTRADLNSMWDLYIAGESGGANEVFPEIYDLTGDERHLATARALDNRASLFGASVEDKDILVVLPKNNPGPRRPDRLHANSHVPQFVGYLRVYEHSGDSDYLDAARNFFGWVVPHREFASGGTGGNYPGSNRNTELFQNRGNIANAIAEAGAETCTAYNMLKLARNLFLHDHDAAYMDHYERGLFNMIAGSRSDSSSTADPGVTYFQPLTPGSRRDYGNTGTCCGGTGLESHTKYQETVYFRSADGSALWVNLYVPSTLTWEDKGFTVTQETKFPRGDTVKLTIEGDGPLDLKLRVPAWATAGFNVTVNGKALSCAAPRPGKYLTLRRTWTAGDVVKIHMPFTIRTERALDRPDTQAIMWGPVLLQALGSPSGGAGSFWELSLYRHLKLDGDYSRAAIRQTGTTASGDPLFTAPGDLAVRPYYISDTQPVSSYFRRVEPEVVFGGLDTGVPNRKRNDGLPNYDVPVAGIESPGSDGPTLLDVIWDEAPFASHEQFIKVVNSTVTSFVDAGVYSAEERTVILEKAREAEEELS
ncbi:acetyl-CoA carboxylase [Plectosphaerella cucumerina]|uniref:Acetyl-CoA carboxylase n=1 Tax=Plectosphaerella cucumerina TaxID=40658 RepID=A0A8K0TKS7_9PEZI|nr:acetyl-CoA carboxylase [Plectosphaerella cucumerina]